MIWEQRRKSSATQVATYRKPLRHESALVAKAPVHRQRVAGPKVLHDHVLHPASLSEVRPRPPAACGATRPRRGPWDGVNPSAFHRPRYKAAASAAGSGTVRAG